jgi:hypothetical protein
MVASAKQTMNHCEATAADSITGNEFVTDLTAADACQLLMELRHRVTPVRNQKNSQSQTSSTAS